MGMFGRIRDGVRGAAERLVRGLEGSNPGAVFEAAIQARSEQLRGLRQRAAGIVVQRDAAVAEHERHEADREAVRRALRAAVAEGDDDTALVLQVRSEELAALVEDRGALAAELERQSELIQAQLVELKQEIASLKREREQAVAELAIAEARIDMQEATSGLSEDPSERSLQTVRSSIGALESLVEGGAGPHSAHSARLVRGQSARAQLAALKRQLGQPDEDDQG
ncbi:MAG TPA: hypothetical protein ENK18_20220 [Deltaproteobacteria bacterium]|nr:hypothetical protein [Deltaproteobacteria bacterium]